MKWDVDEKTLRWPRPRSQSGIVLAHLWEAFLGGVRERDFAFGRLAARVHNLKQHGYDVINIAAHGRPALYRLGTRGTSATRGHLGLSAVAPEDMTAFAARARAYEKGLES